MARHFKRLATVLATGSLALSGVLFTASQASATEHCSSRHFIAEVDTPGTNIDIHYQFCVEKIGGKARAKGYGTVEDGGGAKKVNSFKIESRLEKNNRTVKKRTCDYTRSINARDISNVDCYSPRITSRGKYTADGRIYIDVASDGERGQWHTLVDSAPL